MSVSAAPIKPGRRRHAATAAIVAMLAAAPLSVSPLPFALGAAHAAEDAADPRAGDPGHERSRRLFGALKEILDEAAKSRMRQQTDPETGVSGFMLRQFGADEGTRVRDLLGSAFEMMTDAPVAEMQKQIGEARGEIETMKGQIAELREQRIAAPEDGGWESWLGLSDDQNTLTDAISELERRIGEQEKRIAAQKQAFADAMTAAGAPLTNEQVDLLLESVTGKDLVELAAAYEAVRGVSEHLRQLMDESGEGLTFAKRYYGMHTALIALLVESQSQFLSQIDEGYMPKLDAIEDDIADAARQTERLLDDDPTEAQREALEANARSQKVATDALALYRDYLRRQRTQVAEARERTVKELRVADNTLRTVDASYQLREVMENAATSFEALQSLESPGFERLFRNEQLRREFKELTDKLSPAS